MILLDWKISKIFLEIKEILERIVTLGLFDSWAKVKKSLTQKKVSHKKYLINGCTTFN